MYLLSQHKTLHGEFQKAALLPPARWSYGSPGSPEPKPAPSGAEAVRKGVPAELSIITSSSLG